MTKRNLLVLILVLAVLFTLPAWPYATGFGYYPSGGLGLAVLILIVLIILDKV